MVLTTDPTVDDRWIAEAVRLHRRYEVEIVEALGLCPWAVRTRADDTWRVRVLLQRDAQVGPTLVAIDALTCDARAEVAVLLFPRLAIGRAEFDGFVAAVRDADVPRHSLGDVPFVFAAFHPDAEPDTRHAERLIPFLRRTPDPTIQILRTAALDRVRAAAPQGTQFVDAHALRDDTDACAPLPLRERIARANLATVERVGVDEVARRLDAIRDDRARTYRALAGVA